MSNNTASDNSAIGFQALFHNTTGTRNTAVGQQALNSNTTANDNTGIGAGALILNTTGTLNTATGNDALGSNTNGDNNTATGVDALHFNTDGNDNTASGYLALFSNTAGFNNNAIGVFALHDNTLGSKNNAIGVNALAHCTGAGNTALGDFAGVNATTGNLNVYLGKDMVGVAGESDACYIRSIFGQTSASGIPVLINSNNKLGTATSSKRFKEGIKPMDKASEALFALKPVSFRYKKELDPAGIPQFGLVAEEVENVNPDLVIRDKEGKPYTVRYEQINAMLLNEFLKEHKKVEEQQANITQLKFNMAKQAALMAQQQKGMELLTAQLKEQAAQIQKVSARLDVNKPAPKVVANQ